MAGAGFKTFNTGDVLTASDVNTYLMQQTVMVFDDAAARTSALGANVAEGMMSYLKDTNKTYRYDGSAWLDDAGTTSPLTTKGDVWGYSTTDARIPVGANGTVLTADSSETLGVKWATPSTGTFPKLTFVTPSGNFSTTSTSFVDVTGYSITITPASATNTIQVTANLAVQLGTTSNTEFRILVDGVSVGSRAEAPLEASEQGITVIGYVSNLAATSKICKVQMRAQGGISTTVYGSSSGYISNFSVLEIY